MSIWHLDANVAHGEGGQLLDGVQNRGLQTVNVCVERPVGAIGRLKGAGESASNSRHGFGFVVFFAEEMGLWALRGNGIRGEGK